MGLTLQDIDMAENAVKNVRVILQGIGREIYKIREGNELGPQYGFDRYSRFNFSGPEYMGEEGPDWGVGTPIFSLSYYWPRGEEYIHVTFPQRWLEQDWRALEQERLDKERAVQAERDRKEAAQKAIDREANERRTFERLKAKFEKGPSHDE